MIFNTIYDDTKRPVQTLHGAGYKRESLSLSDEGDSRSAGSDPNKQNQLVAFDSGGGAADGGTIEVVKRPRGRPPGSKNKPKPPIIITKEADPTTAMRPHVLEIAAGHDVADCLARYSRRRGVGLCVLGATGAVANVTLRQPDGGANVGLRGRFDILAISATFLHGPPAAAAVMSLSVSLAGPHGQVVGGKVTGPLTAAGTVVVVAAVFSDPTFHRLPEEEEEDGSFSGGGGGGGNGGGGGGGDVEITGQAEQERDHQQLHQPLHQSHMQHRQAAAAVAGRVGVRPVTMYSCHGSSDFIWAPTARPPPPPPY